MPNWEELPPPLAEFPACQPGATGPSDCIQIDEPENGALLMLDGSEMHMGSSAQTSVGGLSN